MERRYLLGNEAIAQAAREVPVDFVSGYPGTPSSEVIEVLCACTDREYYVEWSVNEKVALENALAAAWCGLRALCTMKHVGLNVASDPLMTSAYTGVTGGLVVMSADDPFAHSSQNEQDSRVYTGFARIPCLDPSSIQEAYDMVRASFTLSEEFAIPVLLRPTTRICHSKGDVEIGNPSAGHRKGVFVKNPAQYVVIPAHTRVLHRKLNEKQPGIRKRLVELGFNWHLTRGTTAVIASGIGAAYVQEVLHESVSFAKIGAYPIDEDWLGDFVRAHEQVLVIEELSPFIEEVVRQVAGETKVFGKKSGHAPYEGELSPSRVASILEGCGIATRIRYPEARPIEGLPPRPPVLCAGCMHRAAFFGIKKVFPDGIYPSDIGCYTLGLQLSAVDTTICMGASITIGSGIVHSGEEHPVICTIGDSTFLHTGIQGLLNAVYNDSNMVVVILDNRITAMTGHQVNPVTGITAAGVQVPPVSLEALCRACGVSYVETVDPCNLDLFTAALKDTKDRRGVKVVIARHPCVITARRAGLIKTRFIVEEDRCIDCGACIRLGCPAISRVGEKAKIGELCSGCTVCVQVCPSGAIIKEGRS
jgi:indolepyruvate ferredoxin oxidoreductase alpha subunit